MNGVTIFFLSFYLVNSAFLTKKYMDPKVPVLDPGK